MIDAISSPQTFAGVAIRLILACMYGALVGLNRQLGREPAGLRTHALVALGAALVTIIGLELGLADASSAGRVMQGLLAGIGFIGGGAILRDRTGVRGVTTAASIWVVAAVGTAAGAGLWRTALFVVFLTLVVLIGGGMIDRALQIQQERRAKRRAAGASGPQAPHAQEPPEPVAGRLN